MTASIPSEAWLWSLADAGARSLLMAGAVGVGLRLLQVGNVMARKVAWSLVLCAAMLMPVITPWAENQSWLPIRAAEVPVQTWLARFASWRRSGIEPPVPVHHYPMRVEGSAIQSTRLGVIGQRTASPALSIDHYPSPAIALDGQSRIEGNVSTPIPAARKLSRGETAFLIYAVVSVILLIRIGVGGVAAARLWMRAMPLPEIEGRFEIEGRIRWSCDLPSPVTVGSGIVLPSDYASWDLEKLRIVLAHEGSHVRQGDFYLQLLAALYGAVFWFSPLGWWLKRTLCDLSEAISDRAAVSEAVTHASYAQVLLEFAALPRTTRIGVAMARAGRLSHRIDRLLDESSFRRAFAGGRGRIAVAALLAPLALFAAVSLRVQAAGQAPPAAAAPATAAIAAVPAAPVAPATSEVPPSPDEMGEPPVAPGPPSEPGAVGPPPGVRIVGGVSVGSGDSYVRSHSQGSSDGSGSPTSPEGQSFTYSDRDEREAYALIKGNDTEHMTYSGDWVADRAAQLEKARRIAHGDFLWFTHDGKSYVVDDPAIVGQISEMYRPMEDLGRRQEELGRQQEELGREQEKLGELMSQASVPAPDNSKEMAELNAAVAELNAARGKNVTQEQLAELQAKLADVQGKLGSLEAEVGARQGEIGAQQGELGAKQGKLGEQQGRLGAEQGRIAREADRRVKSIIDQSLRNGKARPVE